MTNGRRILIFDSHPVQYKAPVYQELQRLRPGRFKVIYFTDCSVRGHIDPQFGAPVAWDVPLMEGYDNKVLNNERGTPLTARRSLHGKGVFRLLKKEAPDAVLLSQFHYEADWVTFFSCLWLGIPIWIRHETQDDAFARPRWKAWLRGIGYSLVYLKIDQAFYIGALNREHLLRHGMKPARLHFSPYCVASPFETMTLEQKRTRRAALRRELGVKEDETLVMFSGKLIGKKNPELLLEAFSPLESRFKLLYVGTGDLEGRLKKRAETFGSRVGFAGFVNQSSLPSYYLAADILVLPSKRMGETWGLVVNEALHAGCAVVVTDAVGCHREFGGWERVRVIKDGDAAGCAFALAELARHERSFDWCAGLMQSHNVKAAAAGIASMI